MREYALVIDEALKKGLAPEIIVPFNEQWLWECLGFRCGKLGLEGAILGEDPLPVIAGMEYNWPFPQYFQGDTINLLIVYAGALDHVYSVSADYLTVTLLDSLLHGTLFDVADFGEYVFMTNGTRFLYGNVTTSTWVSSGALATIPMMGTVCNFRGQAIGGNISTAWYDCDETFYIWSKIGSMDFTPGCAGSEAGYRRCPYGGVVKHVKELGDVVIGYSSKGICLLHTALVGDCQPAVIGTKRLSNVGIHNKGAVGGDEFGHVYVGTDLVVRAVTPEGVKELGYKHLMDELDDEDIIVSFDKGRRDFYIGNSEKTYLLSQYGMTEILQHPSTVWRDDPDNIYMLPDTTDSSKPLITTEVFDMAYKGLKTIVSMETDAMLVQDPEAGVDWVNDLNTWGVDHYKPINNEGIAAITVSGNLFRFSLRFSTIYPAATRIGYIIARYKMSDLRGIRGVYAPPIRGQR